MPHTAIGGDAGTLGACAPQQRRAHGGDLELRKGGRDGALGGGGASDKQWKNISQTMQREKLASLRWIQTTRALNRKNTESFDWQIQKPVLVYQTDSQTIDACLSEEMNVRNLMK